MSKRGVSAVEVLIAVMVAAAVTIPVLALMFQERDTEQRSRFEYMALLAARDEMYQARMLVGLGADPAQVKHDPVALTGHPLDGLGDYYEGAKIGPAYPVEQHRVKVALTIENAPGGASRIRPAKVTATWMDPGTQPGGQTRKTDVELYMSVLRPPWVAP